MKIFKVMYGYFSLLRPVRSLSCVQSGISRDRDQYFYSPVVFIIECNMGQRVAQGQNINSYYIGPK